MPSKWDVKIKDSALLFDFIKEFKERYGVVPSPGFVAGIFKVSMTAVYYHLHNLQKKGKVKMIKKESKKMIYDIV